MVTTTVTTAKAKARTMATALVATTPVTVITES